MLSTGLVLAQALGLAGGEVIAPAPVEETRTTISPPEDTPIPDPAPLSEGTIAPLEPVEPNEPNEGESTEKVDEGSNPAAALEVMEQRLDELADENDELRERVEFLEDDLTYLDERVHEDRKMTTKVGGYVDVGAFWVGGDGTGLALDRDHVAYPEFSEVADTWTFLGDPLSTAINSRGDPASVGDSQAIKFDPINSDGKSSFIVNAINLQFFAGLGDKATANIMLDALPRTRTIAVGDEINLGDYVDLKLAYLTYKVAREQIEVEFYAGKFDPVFGYEYRIQEAADRISVTPSLMCRYTCGRPTGLKSRMRFMESRALILNVSVTNGSSFQESFGFANETDTNQFKTGSARLSYVLPWLRHLEFGASGAFGAQDLQEDDSVHQWQYGLDLHVEVKGLDFTAEFVQGNVPGRDDLDLPPCALSACLEYKSVYGLVSYQAPAWFRPYVRVDWRDALHQSGANFVYVSKLIRSTVGLHFDLSEHAALKAEYTYNRELGKIPQFDNDVVTSSLVGRF